MFQENNQHRQTFMFSSINSLPKKLLGRLKASWAGTFYREIFVRIDEKLFAINSVRKETMSSFETQAFTFRSSDGRLKFSTWARFARLFDFQIDSVERSWFRISVNNCPEPADDRQAKDACILHGQPGHP